MSRRDAEAVPGGVFTRQMRRRLDRERERPRRVAPGVIRRPGLIRGAIGEGDPVEARAFAPVWAKVLRAADPDVWSGYLFGKRTPRDVADRVRSCTHRGDVYEHGPFDGFDGNLVVGGREVACPASWNLDASERAGVWYPWWCGERRFCPVEDEAYAKERQATISRVLLAVAREAAALRKDWSPRLCDAEFTIPKEHRAFFADPRTMKDRHKRFLAVCQRAIEEMYRERTDRNGRPDRERSYTRERLLALPIVANVHPVSSATPWIPKMHAHVLVANVGLFTTREHKTTKRRTVRDRFTKFAPVKAHLTDADRRALRGWYRKLYAQEFGMDLPSNVVIHWSHVPLLNGFSTKRLSREAEHKVRYTFRSFLGDVRAGLRAVNETRRTVLWECYDKQRREVHREIVPVDKFVGGVMLGIATPERYRRIRWSGWLADRKKRQMLRELHGCGKCDAKARGRDVCRDCNEADRVVDGDAPRKKEDCPMCGGRLHRVLAGVGPSVGHGRLYRIGFDARLDFVSAFWTWMEAKYGLKDGARPSVSEDSTETTP